MRLAALLALAALAVGCGEDAVSRGGGAEDATVAGGADGDGGPTGADGGADVGGHGGDGADTADGGAGPGDVGAGEGDAQPGDATADATLDGGCHDGAPCDDGDPCTVDDSCDAGACGGAPMVCDDGLPCTADACVDGACAATLDGQSCVIDGACRAEGETPADAPCMVCAPVVDPTAWIEWDGAPCDDGDPCTLEECLDGACAVTSPALCDDGNPCTADSCTPLVGCVTAPMDGPCDDDSVCTAEDTCTAGLCVGKPVPCKDGVTCTADACHPVSGCYFTASDAACDDGVDCTLDLCEPAVGCLSAAVNPLCSDDQACTKDSCDAFFGCGNAPVPGCVPDEPCDTVADCDDGVPCTVDGCDPAVGCSHAADDGSCADSDPCTLDLCDPASGCTSLAAGNAPCDDGDPCTGPDACAAGTCQPGPDTCGCKPVFSAVAHKAVVLQLGTSGKPGQGVDVDADPNTCAPSGCSGGVDNVLSAIAPFANGALGDAVEGGSIVYLLDLVAPTTDGKPFLLQMLTGSPDPSGPACAFTAPNCPYLADEATFDEECAPLVGFDNAKISKGKLTAGGPGASFSLSIPLGDGGALDVTVARARIEADVTMSGASPQELKGVLGGAVAKSDLLAALEALPADALPPGFTKPQVIGLLDSLIQPDIDVDGDGTKESASIGIVIQTLPVKLTGLQ